MNFLEELRWRGMIHNEEALMPGTKEVFEAGQVKGYIGFDPTGDSLHIGNLATIMLLVHLQRAGHKPIALVGGATGMVGDPSGKDAERQLLSIEKIRHNAECIRKQLEHFLDFEAEDNAAEMVNNYDWFKDISFLDFLRDVGKFIPINYMMAKESVKKRLETGISYTEFAYQLLQGYDFLHLHEHHGVQLQMGGADQWGNITTGTELIRRKIGHEAKAFAVTCPLITREDGTKFGKTADGQSIWLDGNKTTPYQFYQYWFNASDTDARKFIHVFTLKDKAEIDSLIQEHEAAPHLRVLQKAVAEEVTERVHGKEALDEALSLTEFFFAKKITRQMLNNLTLKSWQQVSESSSDTLDFSKETLAEGVNILDFLVELGITSSKGEARRLIIPQPSVTINGERCEDIEMMLTPENTFHDHYMLIQKGKKNKYIVSIS
jgi:tyrosyl-tRNA synthetase